MPGTNNSGFKLQNVTFNDFNIFSLGVNKLRDTIESHVESPSKNIKDIVQKDIKYFMSELDKNSKCYELFLSDYAHQNPDMMGEFRDSVSSCISQIGSLDFKKLSPKKISKLILNFFEKNIHGPALKTAKDMQQQFEKQREDIIKARVQQFWNQQKLLGVDLSKCTLTMSEMERYIKNTPKILNDASVLTSDNSLVGSTNHEAKKVMVADPSKNEVDNILRNDFYTEINTTPKFYDNTCSCDQCLDEKGNFDPSKIEDASNFANSTSFDYEIGALIDPTYTTYGEQTDYAELDDHVVELSGEELKTQFGHYLDFIGSNFKTVDEVTVFQDIIYDLKQPTIEQNPTWIEIKDGKRQVSSEQQTDFSINYEIPQEDIAQYNETIENLQNSKTVEESTSQATLSTTQEYSCLWESKLGDYWQSECLEMASEKMAEYGKNVNIGATVNTVEDAQNLADRLNEIAEHSETVLDDYSITITSDLTTEKPDNFYEVISEGLQKGGIDKDKIKFKCELPENNNQSEDQIEEQSSDHTEINVEQKPSEIITEQPAIQNNTENEVEIENQDNSQQNEEVAKQEEPNTQSQVVEQNLKSLAIAQAQNEGISVEFVAPTAVYNYDESEIEESANQLMTYMPMMEMYSEYYTEEVKKQKNQAQETSRNM